jgi:hypothetical protein
LPLSFQIRSLFRGIVELESSLRAPYFPTAVIDAVCLPFVVSAVMCLDISFFVSVDCLTSSGFWRMWMFVVWSWGQRRVVLGYVGIWVDSFILVAIIAKPIPHTVIESIHARNFALSHSGVNFSFFLECSVHHGVLQAQSSPASTTSFIGKILIRAALLSLTSNASPIPMPHRSPPLHCRVQL